MVLSFFTRADIQSLEAFQAYIKCLSVLDIPWYHHITNADILSLASLPSLAEHMTRQYYNPTHSMVFLLTKLVDVKKTPALGMLKSFFLKNRFIICLKLIFLNYHF